tara:strand:+ start:22 stop:276 length:255 start_codon:yes stop_codon:yes gene_type:complete
MRKNSKNIEKFIKLSLKKINSKNTHLKNNVSLFKQNFDSLDFLKLIFFLEKKYKIQINSKNFSNLQKITALVKHMEKNIEQRTL